jgi:hypothetical protein
MPTINTAIAFDGHQTVALASTGAATYAELPNGFVNIGDQIAFPPEVTFDEDGVVTPVLGDFTLYHVGSDGTITNLLLSDGSLYSATPVVEPVVVSDVTVNTTLSPPSPLISVILAAIGDTGTYANLTIAPAVGDQVIYNPNQMSVTDQGVWALLSGESSTVYIVRSSGETINLVYTDALYEESQGGVVDPDPDPVDPPPTGESEFTISTTLLPPSPLTSITLTGLDDGYMYQSLTSVTVQIGDQFWTNQNEVVVTEDSVWSAPAAGVYDVYHVANTGVITQLAFDVNGLVEYEDAEPDPVPQAPAGTFAFQQATTTTTIISQPYTYSAQDFTSFEHRIDGGPIVTSTSPILIESLTPDQTVTIEVRAINQGVAGAWFSTQAATDAEVIVDPDPTAPVITLDSGDVVLFIGQPYTEPGFSAVDGLDNDITNQVVVTNTHDPSTIGSYTVTYTVTIGGQTTTATRNIFVIEASVDPGQIMPRLQAIGYSDAAKAAMMQDAIATINAAIEADARYKTTTINFRLLGIDSRNQDTVDEIKQRLITKGYTITDQRQLRHGTLMYEIVAFSW